MRLFYSPNSPYARFVRLVLRHHRLQQQITEVRVHPFENPADLLAANTLCKVPTLLMDDGMALFDSEVIALYLDRELGDGSLSTRLDRDWKHRVEFSLVKGLIDSAVMLRGEKWRHEQDGEQASPFFSARFEAAIERTLRRLEGDTVADPSAPASFVSLLREVAIAYIDFRHPEVDIVTRFPALHARLPSRPSEAFLETTPVG